jgi:DNA sulfur modification protein DndC
MFETEDVWTYLLAAPCPWGNNNRDLVTMYRNAQSGECPLVVDTTTPSCGNSRFGCWVCTVVERDKSMEAMIDSGQEWMQPLLDIRNWLAETLDPDKKREIREVRRRTGRVQIWGENKDKVIWGPYKLEFRKVILRRLLEAEKLIRQHGPDKDGHLIQPDELHEIRRLWKTEEGDWEDSVPRIYAEVAGGELDWVYDDESTNSVVDMHTLEATAAENQLPPEMLQELIDLERKLQGLGRRSSVFEEIDKILKKDWRTTDQVLREINWKPESDDDDDDDDDSEAVKVAANAD